MLAENEVDASVTEGINALTESAWIEERILEWERSGEGPGMRDWKRIVLERAEGC